jgi:hypothetical protein
MVEPASIISACVALGKGCHVLYEIISKRRDQNASIPGLRKEIRTLQAIVKRLEEDLKDDFLSVGIKATHHSHWSDVRRVLDDCKETVAKLNRLLAKPGPSQNVLIRVAKATENVARAQFNYSTIEQCRKELSSSRASLNLSIHVIMLYEPPPNLF